MPWEKVHESTQFLNIHVRKKKEVCCRQLSRKSSIFLQRIAGSQVTMLEIEEDVIFHGGTKYLQ
jgi:hypothetical protein